MSAAPSLYRRHRPRTFSDVVGQEHVVRTLRNAIDQGRVHHAYLFVGSRGTGKTSMAKILAAALNCPERGASPDPCGKCESCRSIAGATSLDVIEMDAASNNSVDDIRDLRERVAFAPVSGRSKVYILDEAHMLSTAAWNAFLKTLEEPPPNTVFVLATTEAAKVLPTVVDRCHRFDFTRPTVAQIAGVLRRVAASESIAIPEEASALIARSATGSFRDALGTLEQLVAYAGPAVGLDDVLAVLGAADADLVFGALDAVASGSPREALIVAARVADSGRDLDRFFRDLEAHTRALLVVQTLGGEVPPELRLTADHDERLAAQAARVGATDVVRLLDLIAAGLRATKDGSDARTQLELALVKAAAPEHDASTKALLARIERLERRLAAAPSQPAPPAAPHAPDLPATPAARAAKAPGSPTGAQSPSPPAAPAHPAPIGDAVPDGEAPAPGHRDTAAARDADRAVTSASEGVARAGAAASGAGSRAAGAVAVSAISGPAAAGAVDGARAADAVVPATAQALAAHRSPELAAIAEVWPAVVERLQADGQSLLAAYADEGRPVGFTGDTLALGFPQTAGLSMRKVTSPTCREQLVAAVREVTGMRVRIDAVVRDDAAPGRAVTALSEDDLIDRLKDEFDAVELEPEPKEI